MIERIILGYLREQLDVDVYMEQPENKSDSYVLIEKTGSRRTNHINDATIALQSYGRTMELAAELNETVKAAVDSMTSLNEISSVRLNSDYNFTDTSRKRYRYQAVYDITHY